MTSDVTIEAVHVFDVVDQPVGSVGSIVGGIDLSGVSIEGCTSAATIITPNNSNRIGGIVGSSENANDNIQNCGFIGSISGGSSYVGGIVGKKLQSSSTLTGNYIGSGCTIGAVGVEGSTQGTDEGYDVTRIAKWRFATPQYGDGGTCITPPIVTVQGTDYWAAGQPVAFSELHTFGQTTAGKMWQFVAQTADFERYTLLMYVDPDTTWAFTQPRKDVQITTNIVKDINDTYHNYVSVEVQDSAFFDGQGHRPEVKVWDGVANKGGRWLIEGMDYVTDIPAEGFTAEGEYTVTLWGIGGYGGRQTHTFRVTMPWEGEGTYANPYRISTTDEMDALAHIVDMGLDQAGVHFRQTANLDYTGKPYMPVGRAQRPFNGSYDGYGHTITGVTVSGERYAGLFGLVGEQGELSNVVLTGTCSIEGVLYAGGIVGLNYGNISDCKPQSSNITVKAQNEVGGVAGANNGGFVYAEECRANISVTGTINRPDIGGLVGYNEGGTVLGSFLGTITANKGYVGGIVGLNGTGYVSGEMHGNIVSTGGCEYVGGIVGYNGGCTVENCLSTCSMQSVSGATYAGAIIGDGVGYEIVTNNYYLGTNRYGGINGSDVSGQAMRGWPITWEDGLDLNVVYPSDGSMPPGLYYNTYTSACYVLGAGQTLQFSLWGDVGPASECYANEQHLVATMQDEFPAFEYTMPAYPVHLTLAGNLTAILDDDDMFRINTSVIEAKDGQTLDVKLRGRTFHKDGNWNLLAVPFALPDFAGTPLEDAEVRTIAATSTYADGLLTLDFTDPLTAIEAGKPYFVRWTSGDDITDPVFDNVTIANVIVNAEGNNVAFVPNYDKPILAANTTANLYLGDDNQLHYPYDEEYTLNAMRGHFQVELDTTTGVHVGNCVLNHGTTDTYPMLPAIFQTEGNWNDATKWNTGMVPDGGDVLMLAATTIPSDYVANAEQVIKDATIGLTIKDGGQLYHTEGDLRVTLEKGITAFDPQADPSDGWHLIAMPFMSYVWVGEVNNLTANDYDLYYYDEPTHYWINHKDTLNNNQFVGLEKGKGYLYANSQAVTLDVTNWIEPGNAEVNIPLSYTDGIDLAGFNLVGNPFVHNVTGFTGSNVATECFRLNDTKNDLMVGTIDADHPLLPVEGVFVKATGDNASVTFNGQTRGEMAANGRITLELCENGKLIDRLIVKQDGEPLEKLSLRENSTKLFATLDNQDMAVVIAEGDEQPVNFKAAKNGTYTLTVNVENMEFDYLHLIDNLTGADVDLLQTPQYAFTAKTTDYASRFRLVFSVGVAGETARDPMHR